jgi:SnoaL-like protein
MASQAREEETFMSDRQSIEERIQRLEDIEALKRLKHRYCTHCDDGYLADQLAALFTEEAVWDGGLLGRFEGRDAIREHFASGSKRVSFAIHHVTNPMITVDGDQATCDWLLWEPIVFARDSQAAWMAARYHDRCRRVGDEWLFEHVAIDLRALSPYDAGFGKVRIAEIPR